MTTQEDNYSVSMCHECAMGVANNDFTGMVEDRESEVVNGISLWADDGFHLSVDPENASDFATSRCDVCRSTLHGYRVGGFAFKIPSN